MTRYWFISSQPKYGSKLALLTFALAFIVILLGAYTRLTNAGLSCPDWPNCFGYLTAPHTAAQLKGAAQQYPTYILDVKKAWTEMTHRYFAGVEGILIFILAISLLFANRKPTVKRTFLAVALMSLLCLQVTLGMLTVTEKLKPAIVLAHLLTGISMLCLLWWAYLDSSLIRHASRKVSPLFIPWLWLAVIIVLLQIALGGWVSSHNAGLACIDFPYCNGHILPNITFQELNTDLIAIQMLHRVGAMITALYVGTLVLFMLPTPLRPFAVLMLFTLLLQLALGVLNIVWLRPLPVALMHHAVALFLLLTTIACLIKAYFESKDTRDASWAS